MLVYFTASISAKEKYLKFYKEIIDTLKQLQCQVISDHIIEATEQSINLQPREQRLNFHEKVEKWIQSCDFVIAETSYPATSIGYEIYMALRLGKPVLVLYSSGDGPSLLTQHKDEKLVTEKYDTKTLKQILSDFIDYVEGKVDLRFTFFITPKIIAYLDQVSRDRKIPKSVYLRRLIEKDMERSSHNL